MDSATRTRAEFHTSHQESPKRRHDFEQYRLQLALSIRNNSRFFDPIFTSLVDSAGTWQ
jgi:hypothetical protein